MKALLFGLVSFLLLQNSFACINESVARPEPPKRISAAVHLKRAWDTDLAGRGAIMEADLRNATEFERRIDYAVALIYLGRGPEAAVLLEKLEKEKPGHYSIAANLGTAYELSGNNEKALHWIKEGIRRDANSHAGTEWLHVKILEAKIAHARDSQFFDTHSVLNLAPGIHAPNEIRVEGQRISLEQLHTALKYQLGERLQFVKGPDASVASLLFDYANIEAAGDALESARDLMEMALKFGYPSARGEPLLERYNSQIFWNKARDVGSTVIRVTLVTAVLGFLFWKWLNRPFRHS